jgi:hypothetical protein
MKTEKTKGKEKGLSTVPEKKVNLPAAPIDFERDAGKGFETADKDAYAIPFLVVLQTNSPQCLEGDAAHVKGAKAGMFFNSATKELFDGKSGVVIVPAYYQHRYVEWVPRDQGGGYRGDYSPQDIDVTKLQRNDSGKFVLDNGDYLADTRYHFCVQITPDGPRTVVLAMSSTQIKKSRNWMTLMLTIKIKGKGDRKFTPPTYSHAYKITTGPESNDKGKWMGLSIETDHILSTTKEADIYVLAKEFANQVGTGKARPEEPSAPDGDQPF